MASRSLLDQICIWRTQVVNLVEPHTGGQLLKADLEFIKLEVL